MCVDEVAEFDGDRGVTSHGDAEALRKLLGAVLLSLEAAEAQRHAKTPFGLFEIGFGPTDSKSRFCALAAASKDWPGGKQQLTATHCTSC